MSFFDDITIQDFKDYYEITGAFNFNEFPKWDALVTYDINNQTYYTNYKIYTSLKRKYRKYTKNNASFLVGG